MASNLREQIEEEVSLKELEKLHDMDKTIDLNTFGESTKKHDTPTAPHPDSDDGAKQEEAPKASEESSKSNEPA